MDYYDACDIAAAAYGMDINETIDCDEIENRLCEDFDISLETFTQILTFILPLLPKVCGVLSDTLYQGFVKDDVFLYKKRVENE